MKSSAFDYVRPRSLPEALELLSRHGEDAKLVAGGQSLVPTMNMRLAAPSLLVDIAALPELSGIARRGDVLRIGAGVRQREIERSAEIARDAPLLAKAVTFVAHPAIRNRGTIGGNLAHADPASEMPACMVALGATCNIAGPRGERATPAETFFRGIYETDLRPDEILVSIDVPAPADGMRVSFDELVRRHGDYAMVGLAATARVAGASLTDARLVFFAVADRPVLAAAAARALEGRSGPEAVEAAQAALADELDPEGDVHTSGPTKLHLARVLLARAASELTAQDREPSA